MGPQVRAMLEGASDAELARMADKLAAQDGRAMLRLAFYVIAAAVNQVHGYRPARLRVEALNPCDEETWIPVVPS